MARVLVIYHSRSGNTAKVAEAVAQLAERILEEWRRDA